MTSHPLESLTYFSAADVVLMLGNRKGPLPSSAQERRRNGYFPNLPSWNSERTSLRNKIQVEVTKWVSDFQACECFPCYDNKEASQRKEQVKLSTDSQQGTLKPGNFRQELESTWMKRENIIGKRVGTGKTSKRKSLCCVCVCMCYVGQLGWVGGLQQQDQQDWNQECVKIKMCRI